MGRFDTLLNATEGSQDGGLFGGHIITSEMDDILKSSSSNLKITAFAGTGKTSTLKKYASTHSNLNILYIAFNKSAERHAAEIFPDNVKSFTTHSLGYSYKGRNYKDKILNSIPYQAIGEILKKEIESIKKNKGYNQYIHLRLLTETIKNFCHSKDSSIVAGLVNCPEYDLIPAQLKNILSPDLIARQAAMIWGVMLNTNSGFGMTHDGYLKIMQMDSPKLNYDLLMLDEAQDSNSALLNYIEAQECNKILVGDSHQSIYSFRGAVNAMNKYRSQDDYYLSKSFRFGRAVADMANTLLFYCDEDNPVYGTGNSSINKCDNLLSAPNGSTIITRTNFEVFNLAHGFSKYKKKIYFVGGIGSYNISDLMDIYYLMIREKSQIKNPIYRMFNDVDELRYMADQAMEVDIIAKCNFVKDNFKSGTVTFNDYMNKISSCAVDSPEMADILITNTHKSKGLEYDNVYIAEDFYFHPVHGNKMNEIITDNRHIEEANLLYVAMTRAKKQLSVPSDIYNLNNKVNKILFSTAESVEKKAINVGYSSKMATKFEKYAINYEIKSVATAAKKENIPTKRKI